MLCRRAEPLPAYRLEALLRCSRAVLVMVALTLAADWVAVLVQADRASWNDRTTALIAVLAVLTALAAFATGTERRVRFALRSELLTARDSATDWTADLLAAAARATDRLGVVGPGARRALRLVDDHLIEGRFGARNRPVLLVVLASLASGVVVAGCLAVRERGFGALFLVEVFVFAAGSFAFAVLTNAYLRVVLPHGVPSRHRRAALIASTAAAIAVPLALGLRDSLWSLVGLGHSVETSGQLALVVAAAGIAAWPVAYLVARVTARFGPA